MGGLSSNNGGVPRRLSKPRTNTSSIVLSSSDREVELASSSMPSNQQDYFGNHAAVVSSQGEHRSRRKSRSRIRAYLYGSSSEAVQNPSDDEDGQNTLAGAARDVRKRVSRTGSSIMQIQSAKASTARLSDSSGSRLQLNGSQSSDAEESAILADQIKEKAYQDRMAAQNHITSPVDENKHVDSVMAPVRRKSLYTPGLATRHPSDILKKPPQNVTVEPHFDRDYYYDPSKPKESPLSQLAALQLGDDGRSTPSNMNYPQLGGLQLGTLRVTNGTASPVPRNHTPDPGCRSRSPDSKIYHDYYTASEGSVIGEPSSALPPRGSSPSRTDSRHDLPSPFHDQGITTLRGPSPSRSHNCAVSMAQEYMSELDGSSFPFPNTSGFGIEKDSSDDKAMFIPQDNGSAAEMWRGFIDDAENRHSGNDTQEDALRKLNGTSPSASEYDCPHRPSISYSISSRYSNPIEIPIADSGYGSNASLDANHIVMRGNVLEPGSSAMSQEAHQRIPHNDSSGLISPGLTHMPRTRCISGPREMPQPLSGHGRYSLQESGPPRLPYSSPTLPRNTLPVKGEFSARSPTHKSVRKLQKTRPKSQSLLPILTGQGCRELGEIQIPRVPSIIAAKHAERLSRFPLLDHTFPSSQHTHIDDPVSPDGPCTALYSLPIRFPSPANALEAATEVDPSESRKPDKRESSRSRARSKSRTSSVVLGKEETSHSRAAFKNRQGAVEQVENYEWPASGIVRSPSWSDFSRGRRSKEQKRLAKQDKEDERRLAKEEKELEKRLEKDRRDLKRQSRKQGDMTKPTHSRSTSKRRGKSTDRSSENEVIAIADLGTVTESLGNSPYDIATSIFPRASLDASNWHPHQISTAMPRPKSVFGMDETAAGELAHARSRARSQSSGRPSLPAEETLGSCDSNRTRICPKTMFVYASPKPALAAVDLKAHNVNWANKWQDSQSVSGARIPDITSLDDCGSFPGRSRRVQSIHADVPPVPALPSAQQVKKREAHIINTRPQSIIINPSTAPVPSLPVAQKDSAGATDLPRSDVSRSEKLPRFGKTRAGKIVPDLWTSGSLERKVPRSAEKSEMIDATIDTSSSDENPVAQEDSSWEAQRQAWRARRRSAGEALLRNQVSSIFQDRSTPSNPSTLQELDHAKHTPVRAFTADAQDGNRTNQPRLSPSASFPNPLGSHPYTEQPPLMAAPTQSALVSQHPNNKNPRTAQQALRPHPNPLVPRTAPLDTQLQAQNPDLPQRSASSFTIPRKRIGSGTSTPTKSIERLTGRYDGGLLYGYEPGCGLGGSAGTRSTKTEASRKSVDVSRGFGLDLTDVPIFVAPTPIAR